MNSTGQQWVDEYYNGIYNIKMKLSLPDFLDKKIEELRDEINSESWDAGYKVGELHEKIFGDN